MGFGYSLGPFRGWHLILFKEVIGTCKIEPCALNKDHCTACVRCLGKTGFSTGNRAESQCRAPSECPSGEGRVAGESGFHQVRSGWTWGPEAESMEAALDAAMGIFEAAFENTSKSQGSLGRWTCHSRQGL